MIRTLLALADGVHRMAYWNLAPEYPGPVDHRQMMYLLIGKLPLLSAVVNESFVSIKVDREERPDIDSVYMEAVVAMTGDGGWPMTLVVDADRRPVFAATTSRKAKLLDTLKQIRAVADADPAETSPNRARSSAALAERVPMAGSGAVDAGAAERGVRALAGRVRQGARRVRRQDEVPERARLLEFLLRYTGAPAIRALSRW